MLVQILFEVFQRLIQRLVTKADAVGHFVVRGYGAHLAQDLAGGVVFPHHHAYRIVDRSERSKRSSALLVGCVSRGHDVGEEYLFFLEHVWPQVGTEPCKELGEMDEFRMIASMRGEYFVDERLQPVHFRFGEYVVRVEDVRD